MNTYSVEMSRHYCRVFRRSVIAFNPRVDDSWKFPIQIALHDLIKQFVRLHKEWRSEYAQLLEHFGPNHTIFVDAKRWRAAIESDPSVPQIEDHA